MAEAKVFAVQQEGESLLVVPRGNVGSLAGAGLRSEVEVILDQLERHSISHVVFDLAEAAYFGSEMLAAMHAVWKRLRRREGSMALCNVGELGREILRASRFDVIWPIYPDRSRALQAAGSGA